MSSAVPPRNGSTASGALQILPEAAYEVGVMLLVHSRDGSKYIGNINKRFENHLEHLPAVMVLLGTKVSDAYPSCVGFRIMLRSHFLQTKSSGSLEDNYCVFSFNFRPNRNSSVTFSQATDQDKEGIPGTKDSFDLNQSQTLYKLDFINNYRDGFFFSRHGPKLQTSDIHTQEIKRMLPLIPSTQAISLFFPADDILIAHLKKTIMNDCVGVEAQSWKVSLPESAIPKWPQNVQTRMVAGSINMLNVLSHALHDGVLQDGSGTSLNCRPQAKRFREFLHATYPSLSLETMNSVYPVFLDVVDGLCVELPFGASMFNRENTYAGINALHLLLRSGIPGADVGIVTLYPAQVQAYRNALQQCHKYAPKIGYDAVTADVLEEWVGKEIGITVIDLVRTANASGNLGYLSQARRLKLLFSLHRNGMIVIGDQKCTVTSQGTVTSAKLHKVLQWFSDNGRVVSVKDGLPQHPSQESMMRRPLLTNSTARFAGLPELENLTLSETTHEAGNMSKPVSKKQKISESFARQGFLTQKQAAFQPSASKRETRMVDGESPQTDLLQNRGTLMNPHKPDGETKPPHFQNNTNSETQMPSPEQDLRLNIGLIPVDGEVIEPHKQAQIPIKANSVEQPDESESGLSVNNGTARPGFSSAFDPLASQLKTQAHQQGVNENQDPKAQISNHGLNFVIDRYTHQSKSQVPEDYTLSASVLRADRQPGKHIDLRQVINKAKNNPISLRPDHQKTKQQDLITGPSAQVLRSELTKIGNLVPPLKPTVKLYTPNTAPDQQQSRSTISPPATASTPATTTQNGQSQPPANDLFAPGPPQSAPGTGLSSLRNNPATTAQPPAQAQEPLQQMNPDFQRRYRAKYHAIRSIFDSLHDDDHTAISPLEDHLFRRLAEAYISDDAGGFDAVYVQLLGVAKGLLPGGSGEVGG